MKPTAAWPVGAALAECPFWDSAEGALYWIDILGPSFNRLNPDTGATVEMLVPDKIGSAVPGGDGRVLLALETGLWLMDANMSFRRLAQPDFDNTHFNDGKCDPQGRFWVGSRSSDGSLGKGSLYRVDCDETVVEMAKEFDVCNGLGWSPDGTIFYIVDTVPRLLYRYDFDPLTGAIANRRILYDFANMAGKPDGLAIDRAGNIWCAMWDGWGITVISPDGARIGWVDTPCPRPTSCAFGGMDGHTLFVTSASFGLDPADETKFGLSGQIMAFRSPIAGTPVSSFGSPLEGSTTLSF